MVKTSVLVRLRELGRAWRVLDIKHRAKLFKIGLSLNDKCIFCDSSKDEFSNAPMRKSFGKHSLLGGLNLLRKM